MKLKKLRFCNFQSFGSKATEISLAEITYLIGPNGSGKTAALQGLCRLFAFDPAIRRVQRSDFHVPHKETEPPKERTLWLEADFEFPELAKEEDNATVPPHFAHMRLDDPDGEPRVRYRLEATMDAEGHIEESFVYILDLKEDGTPLTKAQVPRGERNLIQVHYLPARRDPAQHITYGSNALLGRLFRAVNWTNERAKVKELTDEISSNLSDNTSVKAFSASLKTAWGTLHKGSYFADPKVSFIASEVEALLRHLSVSFAPGHEDPAVDFSRLSDGQKSMLYLSLVISSQAIGRKVLAGDKSFDAEKLRPPVFTLVAIEEPENSLSPHYLGRIVNSLAAMTEQNDAQALIATHAPSMLRRVDPKKIRYLRLNEKRVTKVTAIRLPAKNNDSHKFVREAVQAFPEIYFSRLVILGEGDSEEIVLPRVLRAKGIAVDESAVTIAPLGGRHVNHFWRLLNDLKIPHLTLLDLDVARFGGGWGRFNYANLQLIEYRPEMKLPEDHGIPNWNSTEYKVRDYEGYIAEFEQRDVFFSAPLDLDFSMLQAFPVQYQANPADADPERLTAVLGKNHGDAAQYTKDELKLFESYHRNFKLGSKPAAHIDALAKIKDTDLAASMPPVLARLADRVSKMLNESPE